MQHRSIPGPARLAVFVFLGFITMSLAVASQTPAPYKAGPEDVINVFVARHPELSGDFYIPSDGTVDLPGAGQVEVANKTLAEISECVRQNLSKRLQDPEVTVTLKSPRMQRINVLGNLLRPGLYDLKPGWRITEAISAAGGLATDVEPSDCIVTLLRATDGKSESVKLTEVMRGVTEANLTVNTGDVVAVTAQETLPVYVMGKVKTPGIYRLRTDSAGVVEALTLAGGVMEDAAITRVSITHLSGPSESVDLLPALLEGKNECNIGLKAGDMVLVPEETSRIAVLGYVNEPGFFPLRNGQKLMLSNALGLAKGVDKKDGKIDSVVVIRTENGKQERMVCDLGKFLKSGDMASNPEIKAGDVIYVPRRTGLDWQSVVQSLTAVGIFINPFIP